MNPLTVGQQLRLLQVSMSSPGHSEERTQRNVSDVARDHLPWKQAVEGGQPEPRAQATCVPHRDRPQAPEVTPWGLQGGAVLPGQLGCRPVMGGGCGSLSPTGGAPSPPPPPPLPPAPPECMWLHYLDVPFGGASSHLSATCILPLVSRSLQGTGVLGLLGEQGEAPGLV